MILLKNKKVLTALVPLVWTIISALIGCKLFYTSGRLPLIFEQDAVHSFSNLFPKELSKRLLEKDLEYLKKTAMGTMKQFNFSGIIIKGSENKTLISMINPNLETLNTSQTKTTAANTLSLQKTIDTPEMISIENGNLYRIRARSLLFSNHMEAMTLFLGDNYAGSVYIIHSGGIVSTGATLKDVSPYFSAWLLLTIMICLYTGYMIHVTFIKGDGTKDKKQMSEVAGRDIHKVYYLPDPSYKIPAGKTRRPSSAQSETRSGQAGSKQAKAYQEPQKQKPKPQTTMNVGKKRPAPSFKGAEGINVSSRNNQSKTTVNRTEAHQTSARKSKTEEANKANDYRQTFARPDKNKPRRQTQTTSSEPYTGTIDSDDWFLLGPYKLNRSTLSENEIFQNFQAVLLSDSATTYYAFKRLKPRLYAHKEVCNAFFQEAYNTKQLMHPSIAGIVDIRKKDYAIVREYVQGKNLSQLLISSPSGIPLKYALHIISEVCAALDYAFTSKTPGTGEPLRIIHKNLTLNNVLVTSKGTVKVSDFGLYHSCKSILEVDSGTPHPSLAYMAPEQINSNMADVKTDIFSVGSIFYELLSGRRLAYSPENPSKPVIITKMNNDLIEPVMQCIERAVAHDRKKRFSSAIAMYNEVQKLKDLM